MTCTHTLTVNGLMNQHLDNSSLNVVLLLVGVMGIMYLQELPSSVIPLSSLRLHNYERGEETQLECKVIYHSLLY